MNGHAFVLAFALVAVSGVGVAAPGSRIGDDALLVRSSLDTDTDVSVVSAPEPRLIRPTPDAAPSIVVAPSPRRISISLTPRETEAFFVHSEARHVRDSLDDVATADASAIFLDPDDAAPRVPTSSAPRHFRLAL